MSQAANIQWRLDSAVRFERAVLGCLIEKPSLWPDAELLSTDDFLLSDHQKIYRTMCRLREDLQVPDITTLEDALEGKVAADYLSTLVDGCVTEAFGQYVRKVQEAARERRICTLSELLASDPPEKRLERLEELGNLLRAPASQDWRSIFHDYQEVSTAPDPEWLIEKFAEVEDIVMIGGPSGHGKSLLLLSMCRALLTQEPLFHYAPFRVPKASQRVLYLVPEVGLRSFRRRLEWFHLLPFVESQRLFVRTLSHGPVISLTDPRILAAAEGADVVLDTAVRFSEGDESSASDNRDGLAATLFGLSRAGARSVICAHHSPKDFATKLELTLENCLRGSGDIGAMLSTAYGIRQVDRVTNRILIANIKPRDIDPLPPFEVQGRPFISECGDFRMIAEPSEKSLVERIGETKSEKAFALATELFAAGKSANFVAEELKNRGLGKQRGLILSWQKEFKGAGTEGGPKNGTPLRSSTSSTGPNGECRTPLEGGCSHSQDSIASETSQNQLN